MLNVIYEDDSILVIDKPAGLRVDKDTEDTSLEDQLQFPVERHGIVHRIDKETSGLVIVAKTEDSYNNLKQQFASHTVKKTYECLAYEKTPESGTIKTFIARDPKRKQAMKVIDYPTGTERGKMRESITHFKREKIYTYRETPLSYVSVIIETGRTHQIRVSMQSIGHPLIGDMMYGSKTSKQISEELGINRQFLHATELTISHPLTQESQTFTSYLPQELKNVLEKLQ